MNKKEIYQEFQECCRNGKIAEVKSYLKTYPELLNGIDEKNSSLAQPPIAAAIVWNHPIIADYLLSEGADINIQFETNNNKITLLHQLIESEIYDYYDWQGKEDPLELDTKMIQYVIEHNGDLNKEDNRGFTPLDLSIEFNHLSGANLLVKNGAKHSKLFFKFLKKEGFPPDLLKACPYLKNLKEKDCIETYVKPEPPKPKTTNYHYELDRIMSSHKIFGNPLNLGFLENKVKNGFDINEKDYLGRTPVDYAIELGNEMAVEFLRKNGGKTTKELEQV